MAQNKNNVRMADIAKELHISTVAVSKALNNQKGVSEELRQQVKELAKSMGYHSPAQLRRMQGKTGYNIGVLIPTQYLGSNDAFYWKLYQEVTARAMKKDCFVLLELLSNEDAQAKHLPKLITEDKADGLIIIGKPPFDYAKALKNAWHKPIVYLDFYDSDISADSVISNGFYGTFLLTQHLIERGHKDIGFVGTLLATDSITDRYLGYTKAMLDTLFDEKIAGSFHFTPGQAYENCDNGNRSQVHWDMVCIQRADYGGGEIWFDDELIRKDGIFTDSELAILNP